MLILVEDQPFIILKFWHFVVAVVNDLLVVSKNLIISNIGGLIGSLLTVCLQYCVSSL